MEIDMSKLIYSRNGSETTESIDNAQPQIRAIWNQAHRFGANIVRVRAEKNRFGTDTGRTFNSFHHDRVSVYKQKDEVRKSNALYFARKIPLTKANKGQQKGNKETINSSTKLNRKITIKRKKPGATRGNERTF